MNQAEFIPAAVESVLSQSYSELELIIADGCSTDGTIEWLKQKCLSDTRLRFFSETDSGPADALNKSLKKARGTIIGWLNSDDLYTEGAIDRAVNALQSNPAWMMVYGHGEHIDEVGKLIERYPSRPATTPIEEFANGCFICQPTVFFKRSMNILLGPLDESLKTAFDFDYWLRAFYRLPGRIGFIDAVQAQSRLHADCITLKMRGLVAVEGMRVVHKYLGYAPGQWMLSYLNERLSIASETQTSPELLADIEGLLNEVANIMSQESRLELHKSVLLKLGTDIEQCDYITTSAISFEEVPLLKKNTMAEDSDSCTINPKKLIERFSITEHLNFADDYFTGRANHLYLYQKPFYHPKDCAPSVCNLGQLLAGMQLERDMKVLDFAAGSCWLSRILVQLGCHVTSCDASQNALDIGKALFNQYPPITETQYIQEFALFDGESFDFADKSFDRILVNDAFHHIPNVEIILKEFSRILKDDGIVGMSEPGREHSKTEASQYEMRVYNVIENDFILEDIWKIAQSAGFVDIEICPVLRTPYLSVKEYLQCISGNVPDGVLTSLAQDTTNYSIFFLHKRSVKKSIAENIYSQPEFDEVFYLGKYQDVAYAVAKGEFPNGWVHYELYGRDEGRVGKQ